MKEPRATDSGISFLQALARRANIRVVVYVPTEGTSHSLWISHDVGDAEEIAALEDLGRLWLSRLSADGPSTDEVTSKIAYAALRSADTEVIGVVVAVKEAGLLWTAPEREVVRFALEFYGPSVDPRAGPEPFVPEHATTPTESDLESGIRDAVARGELVLVYQPEFDLVTCEVVAVEALLRWQHPQRGQLGPESFIALAERSGLITIIGEWVIDAAVCALASWNARLPGLDLIVRVNVSPVQMNGADLVTLFKTAMETHGVPGRQLCIELTEDAPLRDPVQVAETLRQLKALGIVSAIDDLATGYSTLSQLRSLPVDIIKLDRSLVSGIDQDPRAEAIVTALIGLALNFGLGVVAEGVENENEVAALLRLGCTRAQGHHLGKPVPADSVVELLRERGNVARKTR